MNDVQFIKMILMGLGIVSIPGLILVCLRSMGYNTPIVQQIQRGYRPWLVMCPLLVFVSLFGMGAITFLFGVVSLLCIKEYARATGLYRDLRLVLWLYFGTMISFLCALFFPRFFNAALFFILLPLILFPLVRNTYEGMLQKVALGIIAVVVLGWFPAHLICLSLLESGRALLLFVIIGVELGDASAFVLGKMFGKRKLISKISPNKTWEGACGALFVVALFTWGIRKYIHLEIPWYAPFVLWGGGMAGDLFISFIKREVGVKDMGFLIRGHGGMLDRFDSLLLASPLYFYLCGGLS